VAAETSENSIKRIMVIVPLLSLILGIGGAWGVIQYKDGSREQRVLILESQVKELKEQSMTRKEMKLFMDSTTDGIRGIREDIRDLRRR